MDGQLSLLKLARERRGWSQEQAIVRLEGLSQAMGVRVPVRSSLRTLLSMFENSRRIVPDHYQPIFRELYRATDEELGFSGSTPHICLPVPPPLPADLPETASPEILSYLANVLAEHVKADAVVGPRYLVPTVQSQLPLIDRLCQVTRGPDRSDVLSVAVQFAEFCGWLYQDSGNSESAVFWTNTALDYAQELNDPQIISYIMMRKSNIATESGRPGHGLGLAIAALNAYDVLTPRMRAVSLRQLANAHALLLEHREFEESVDLAMIQASDGTQQTTPDLATYCTESYVAMDAGIAWAHLGRTGPALDVFERSLAAWPVGSQTRDRGLCLARLATVSAAQGNIERSCLAGAEALAIARSTGSARIRNQLHALYTELAPHESESSVRHLRGNLVRVT